MKTSVLAGKPWSLLGVCRAAIVTLLVFTLAVQLVCMTVPDFRGIGPHERGGLGASVGYFAAAGRLLREPRSPGKHTGLQLPVDVGPPLAVFTGVAAESVVDAPELAADESSQLRTDSKDPLVQKYGREGSARGLPQKGTTQEETERARVLLGDHSLLDSNADSDSGSDRGIPHLAAGARSVLEAPTKKAKTRGNKSKEAKKVDSSDPAQLQKYLRRYVNLGKAYMAVAEEYEDADLAADFAAQLRGGCQAALQAGLRVAPQDARSCMEELKRLILLGKEAEYDSAAVVAKLRQKLEAAEAQTKTVDLQSKLFSQMAAKAVPKGMHCLAMKLMVEHMQDPEIAIKARAMDPAVVSNPALHHYALFSDNVLATAVVVNSTAQAAADPSRHVFHIVTDRMNLGAMQAWFVLNPPRNMTVDIKSLDDFEWINPQYVPVLRQIEQANMRNFYFRSAMVDIESREGQDPTALANFKYRNPKYLSILNHLRFYLPKMFPHLSKVLFLDEDVVVQRDLSPLWGIDMGDNVNLAVETCGEVFHRFHTYLNFSNPLIAERFDPQGCGWAFGMNLFNLQAWREGDYTEVYHDWQQKNIDRQLWRLGTLPPALMTFYGKTQVLDKSWHLLGLGCNPNVSIEAVERAAVLHYNGHAKPWLELAMKQYQGYWTRHVAYWHEFLQQCNIMPP